MTDPFDTHPLDASTADAAWRMYTNHQIGRNAAAAAMEDAGLTYPDALSALDAEQPPSQGYLAVTR